jgi:hypothetical protein
MEIVVLNTLIGFGIIIWKYLKCDGFEMGCYYFELLEGVDTLPGMGSLLRYQVSYYHMMWYESDPI